MVKQRTSSLPLLPLFHQFIAASKSGRRHKCAGKKLAPGTITQYQCIEKLLLAYENHQGTTLSITLLKKFSLPQVKKEQRYWTQFFKSFTLFLYHQKGCFDCYVAGVCKTLRTFFNWLREEKHLPIGNYHKNFTVPQPTFTPLILEPQKLQFLIKDKAFSAALPPHLQRTKDLFVFGCTVALRYSDLVSLRKENLVEAPEGVYLQLHTQKTSTLVKLPLPDYLVEMINRYRHKKGKYLLPRLSSTNLNLQVKELCRRAGWTYDLPKVRYRMGRPVELKHGGACLKYYEQVTTHTMRRTAITTLLIMGVPELVVRRISGHSANSREFYRYVVIAQDYLNRHVLQAYDKLLQSS